MSPAPGQTPFVGRARELRALAERLEAARDGSGAIVLIAGEAGIGKTRLVQEAVGEAASLGWRVLVGRALEQEGAAPYAPLSEALEPIIRDTPLDDLTRMLGEGASDVALVSAPLRRRLPGLTPRALASESERQRLLQHLTAFVAAAAASPTILVLEDLHWADPATLAVLSKLAADSTAVPLAVFGTYRDNEVVGEHPATAFISDLKARKQTDMIRLTGLKSGEVAELVSHYAEAADAPALPGILLEETGGNALFLTETVRLLAAEGRFAAGEQNAGRWRLATLPSVRDVIVRRTQFLPEAARRLLQLGAVCGREFDLAVLSEVPSQQGVELLDAVAAAEEVRLIEASPGSAGRYQFAHPLVRDAIYNDTPSTERIRLHREAGLTIERLAGPGAASQASTLAYHFLQALAGGEAARAIRYAHLAGDQAMEQFAYEGAAQQYASALDLLQKHDGENQAERCALLLGRADAIARSGETTVSRALYQEVAALAESLGMHELLVRAALGHAGYRAAYAMVDPASVDLLERALRVLSPEETVMQAQVMARLAMELYYTRERERRIALSDEALALARAEGDAGTLALVLKGRHYALHEAENSSERLAVAMEMVRLAERAGDSELALQGHYLAVYDLLEIGDIEGADLHIAEHCRLGEANPQPLYVWRSDLLMAMRDIFAGRLADGEARALSGYAIADKARIPNGQAAFGAQINLIRLQQDRAGEMLPSLRAAVAVTGATVYRAILAMFAAAEGEFATVESELSALAANDFLDLSVGEDFFICGYSLVQACVALSDAAATGNRETPAADWSRRLSALLQPYSDRVVVVGGGVLCMGPVSRLLGQLAVILDRWDDAVRYFDDSARRSTAMGVNVWPLYTEYDRAWMLARRNRSGDAERAASLLPMIAERATELGLAALAKSAGALLSTLSERGSRLSARETDVLIRMALGETNKEIAAALSIGTRTVDSHVERIYQKLGARGRADAIAYALQAGLVDASRASGTTEPS